MTDTYPTYNGNPKSDLKAALFIGLLIVIDIILYSTL